ncbi:hypothetical protein AB0B12_35450 [Streptomyces sp. NPDC044780]|uniref:hypothetical protein n=1 Tax=unclassified Streptomyces TaxID=2593676 RepID=UPI003411681D
MGLQRGRSSVCQGDVHHVGEIKVERPVAGSHDAGDDTAGRAPSALFKGVRRQGRALAIAVTTWAAAIALAGTVHHLLHLLAAAALLAAAGAADLVSAVYRETILQTYAPDAMRGRLQGVFTVVVAGGPRLGDLRAGAMAAATGLGVAWTGSSLLCMIVVIAGALLVRPFWRYTVTLAQPPSPPMRPEAAHQP